MRRAALLVLCGLLPSAGPLVIAQDPPRSPALEAAYGLDAAPDGQRDPQKVVAAYQVAADQGDPWAILRLGVAHELGDGVPQDYARARSHYERAAAAGLPEARVRLALCHLEGWGGPVDRDAFLREVRLAAEANHVPAQRILAGVYATGFAATENLAEAVKWLERAAAQDDPAAQFALAESLDRGIRRSARNRDLASTWFELSAEQEYTTSMRALARRLYSDAEHPENRVQAIRWLELATELGDSEAPFILAVIHSHDRAGDERGLQWLRLASARLNNRATEVLDLVSAGRSLQEAVRFVLTVPFDERYVQTATRAAERRASEGQREPIPTRIVRPLYPQALRMSGVTGEAVIRFVVDTTGRVTDVETVRATHPLFGERAAAAVATWRFTPGVRDGRLVNVRMQLPLHFEIEEETLSGVEGMIGFARDRALKLGPQVETDTAELSLAIPAEFAPLRAMPDGQRIPNDAKGLVLLVIDGDGRASRAHLLHAEPESLGPVILSHARAQRYRVPASDEQRTHWNVLVPYRFGPAR